MASFCSAKVKPNQNLTREAETSPCNCGWASFSRQTLAMPCAPLEDLQNSSLGFCFPDQKLGLYLPGGNSGVHTPGNKVGWLEGPALLSWMETGSWDLMFASHGRVPSKATHQLLLGNEGELSGGNPAQTGFYGIFWYLTRSQHFFFRFRKPGLWLTPELALFYKNNTVVIRSLNQYWLKGRWHLEGIEYLPFLLQA